MHSIYVLSSFVYIADMFLLFVHRICFFGSMNRYSDHLRTETLQFKHVLLFIYYKYTLKKLSHKGTQRHKMCMEDEAFRSWKSKTTMANFARESRFRFISCHTQFLFVLALLVFPNSVASLYIVQLLDVDSSISFTVIDILFTHKLFQL